MTACTRPGIDPVRIRTSAVNGGTLLTIRYYEHPHFSATMSPVPRADGITYHPLFSAVVFTLLLQCEALVGPTTICLNPGFAPDRLVGDNPMMRSRRAFPIAR